MESVAAIERFVSQHHLVLTDPFLVAVSGGRDSICLLHALQRSGFSQLTVCHLNHGLRGGDSDGDACFVRDQCSQLDIDVVSEKVDLAAYEGGMETAARTARYEFFDQQVEQLGAKGVFLGHHADDQAETILFNLFRGGAGLRGMNAVAERQTGCGSYQLLRPLLALRRKDLEADLQHWGADHREDSSNAEPCTARNRIRLELLPLAEALMQRDVVPAIQRAFEHSSMQQECVEQMVDREDLLDPQGRLYLPGVNKLPVAARRLVVHRYLRSEGVPQLSTELIDRIISLMDSKEGGKLNLPGGKFLRKRQQRLLVEL